MLTRAGARFFVRLTPRPSTATVQRRRLAPRWVCRLCELIGTTVEAEQHAAQTGYPAEQLDEGHPRAVREVWR